MSATDGMPDSSMTRPTLAEIEAEIDAEVREAIAATIAKVEASPKPRDTLPLLGAISKEWDR